MYLLACYVPKTHVEIVKSALFRAGAGRFGKYDSCCFEIEGVGQFRPLPGSAPFLGRSLEIERVIEVRIEMICDVESKEAVVAALRQAHPYEEPAYHLIPIVV